MAALSPYTTDWLDLLIRWLHVIAGIAWIGASFYFIALDYHLLRVRKRADLEKGVGGEAWEIHGGGFYHVQKYRALPPYPPERLHWFKWEAYTTWLSGFALFVVLYYLRADSFLVDDRVADISEGVAVAISIGLLAGGWLVYDTACRLLERNERVLAVVVTGLLVAAAWGSWSLFSPRAAYIQVGAMIGTIMVANVFFVIIPGQRELVSAMHQVRQPDPRAGLRGKQRSVHNNYLTLPVVFAMISNHFPRTYGHEDGWLVLLALMAIGAWVRHFFNLRHQGRTLFSIPVTAAVAIALVAVWIRPQAAAGVPADSPPAAGDGKTLFGSAGCGSCHTLADAGATGTIGPDLDAARPSRALVLERVTNGQGVMPSFRDELTEAEIAAIADYVSSVARE